MKSSKQKTILPPIQLLPIVTLFFSLLISFLIMARPKQTLWT